MRDPVSSRSPSVTLRQIAQRAGCAVSVVSTVLNGARSNTRVSTELRGRVLRCAAELGYEPNYHARSLRSSRSRTIGMLFGPDEPTPTEARFFAPLMHGVEWAVRSAGSDLLLIGPSPQESDLARGVRYFRQRRIDALVLPGMMYAGSMPYVADADAPIVVALPLSAPGHPSVQTDLSPGIRAAAEHLAELGHAHVLYVGPGPDSGYVDPTRSAQVEACAHAAGLRFERWTLPSVGSLHGTLPADLIGAVRAQSAVRLCSTPTPGAVIAYNEVIAAGFAAGLRDMGMRVPEDVSLIGFDDIVADLAAPPMTVVSLRLRDVGSAAARLALEMAGDPSLRDRLTGHVTTLPAHLVVRGSTGPAPCRGRRLQQRGHT